MAKRDRTSASASIEPRARRLGVQDVAALDVGRKRRGIVMRQSPVAPRAEPSRRGAKQWVGGRRNKRKYH